MSSALRNLLIKFIQENADFWDFLSSRPKLRVLTLFYFAYSRGRILYLFLHFLVTTFKKWRYETILKRQYSARFARVWAVVATGGSQRAVGRAFAIELQQLGLNVLLLNDEADARDEFAQLQPNPHSAFRAVQIDFTSLADDPVALEQKLVEALAGLEISLLVNAVDGVLFSAVSKNPPFLASFSPEELAQTITGNLFSVFLTTKVTLQALRTRT